MLVKHVPCQQETNRWVHALFSAIPQSPIGQSESASLNRGPFELFNRHFCHPLSVT